MQSSFINRLVSGLTGNILLFRIVCIVGGVIAVIMCVQLYLELCNTYMSAPFKVITFVLGLILVVSILRIIVCNETK